MMTNKAIDAAVEAAKSKREELINAPLSRVWNDVIDAAIAVYEAALWQPIETAPRDREIQLRTQFGDVIGWWTDEYESDGPGWTAGRVNDWGLEWFDRVVPTLWRDLPTSPQETDHD